METDVITIDVVIDVVMDVAIADQDKMEGRVITVSASVWNR